MKLNFHISATLRECEDCRNSVIELVIVLLGQAHRLVLITRISVLIALPCLNSFWLDLRENVYFWNQLKASSAIFCNTK